MEDFQGKYNGEQIEQKLDKIKDMVGATASEAGAAGLVPGSSRWQAGVLPSWRWNVAGYRYP